MAITKIIFGLGSNLGDKELNLKKAVSQLESRLFLIDLKQSSILKNPALLLPNSPPEWELEFFNIALSALIDVEKFSPEKILQIVKEIEQDLGRVPRDRWAPREIDIDILMIEDIEIDLGDCLKIPHPQFFERDFVVKTVSEIEPLLIKKP